MARTTVVADEFRKNDLSLIPGGNVVTVIYKNGSKRVYNKVKNVDAYLSQVRDADIVEVLVNGQSYWKASKK